MGRALNVIGVPTGAATFSAALEGLTALDEQLLRDHPELPALADSGVVYDKSPTSKWRTVVDILNGDKGPKLKADCEALAPWRAAELRVSGEDPAAHVLVYPSGTSKFHAIVMRGDGTLEDPSLALGMKGPPQLLENYGWWNATVAPMLAAEQPAPDPTQQVLGFDEDVACIGVAEDPTPGKDVVTFEVHRTDDGFRGEFRVPFIDGRALFGQSSTSATPEEAEDKATKVLGFVGSIWDDLSALAPTPGAKAAINIARNQHVQNLAKAAYGKASGLIHHGGGGGSSHGGRAGGGSHAGGPFPISTDDQGNTTLSNGWVVDASGVIHYPDGSTSADQAGASSSPSDAQQPLSDDTDSFFSMPPGGGNELDDVTGADDDPRQREQAIIGWINGALASGSSPNPHATHHLTEAQKKKAKAKIAANKAAGLYAGMPKHKHHRGWEVGHAGRSPSILPFKPKGPGFGQIVFNPWLHGADVGAAARRSSGHGGSRSSARTTTSSRAAQSGGRGGAAQPSAWQQQPYSAPQAFGGGGYTAQPYGGGYPAPGGGYGGYGGFGGGGRAGMMARMQQQQQQGGGGGGGDYSGGGGGGGDYSGETMTPGASFVSPEDFFSGGYGGTTMSDADFAATAQLSQQIDQFEGDGDDQVDPSAWGN